MKTNQSTSTATNLKIQSLVQSIQNIILPRPRHIKAPTTVEADIVSLPEKRSRPPMPPMRTLPHLVRQPQDTSAQKHLQRPKLVRSWDTLESDESTRHLIKQVKNEGINEFPTHPANRPLNTIVEEVDEFGHLYQTKFWEHEPRRLEQHKPSFAIKISSSV